MQRGKITKFLEIPILVAKIKMQNYRVSEMISEFYLTIKSQL